MNDNVTDPGQPTMKNGPQVDNVSGSVATVGDTVRPAPKRDATGRYRSRSQTLIRGLDAPGTERTEMLRDSVTGQMIRGRNNAVLHRDDGPVHYLSLDQSGAVDPMRKSNAYIPAANSVIDHLLGCIACATGGACNGR